MRPTNGVGWTGIVWPAGAASAVTAAKVAQAANPAVAKAVVVRRVGGRKVRTVGLQGDVGVTGRGGGSSQEGQQRTAADCIHLTPECSDRKTVTRPSAVWTPVTGYRAEF